jgi:hypothetical protein
MSFFEAEREQIERYEEEIEVAPKKAGVWNLFLW